MPYTMHGIKQTIKQPNFPPETKKKLLYKLREKLKFDIFLKLEN